MNDMANDLGISEEALTRQRDAGDIPDQAHDTAVIARSIEAGKPLTSDDIAEHRSRRSAELARLRRRQMIVDFIESAGGVDRVATAVGMTRNALDICKHRGTLSRLRKYEFMTLAGKVGAVLPDDLFTHIR